MVSSFSEGIVSILSIITYFRALLSTNIKKNVNIFEEGRLGFFAFTLYKAASMETRCAVCASKGEDAKNPKKPRTH
jgi:hypothetical protein